MRHLYLSIAMLLAVCFAVSARQISENEAMLKAAAFGQKAVASRLMSASRSTTMTLAYTQQSATSTANNCFYVFNRGTADGYIIVSADDRTDAILGYTDSGSFNYASLPDNARWWFSEYQRQIQYLIDHPDYNNHIAPKTLTKNVAPLCKSLWNQDSPYNDLCPIYTDSVTGNTHCATGCAATAMAQIMYYHKWPATGIGSNSYTSRNTYGSDSLIYDLAADFSKSTYDWANMTDRYNSTSTTAQNAAVAKLMSDAGISVNMAYGTVSLAGMLAPVIALANNFGYDSSISLLDHDFYSGAEWESILANEIDNNRPILYMGAGFGIGHAFVCDGYNSDGLFHFNWGWGGLSNGYFKIDLLDPPIMGIGGFGGGFNIVQAIITHIMKSTGTSHNTCNLVSSQFGSVNKSVTVGQNVPVFISDISNLNYKPFTGALGFVTRDAEGNIKDAQQFVNITSAIIPEGTRIFNQDYDYTVPSNLSDSVYTMDIECLADDGNSWVPVRSKVGGVSSYAITVSGTSASVVSSASGASLSASAPTFYPALYSGHSSVISTTVSNAGTDFHGIINMSILDTNGNEIQKQLVVADIAAGQSEPVNITTAIKVPAGNARIQFSVPDSIVIGQADVNIKAATAQPALALTAAPSFPDKDNVDPNNIMLSATITNTGGIFTDQITANFFDANGNYLSRRVVPLFIDQNETKTITFTDGLGFAVQGTTYIVQLVYNDDNGAQIPLTPIAINTVYFKINATPTSIGSVGTSANSIFPNPATDVVTVCNANAISGISVYSVTGAIVLSKAISGQNSVTLNVATLPAGTYIVRVATSAGITTQRFIKK
jgi:hypothetical protein